MTVKELMVGDLVMATTIITQMRPCKVVTIEGERDFVGLYDIEDEDKELIARYTKYVEPIPLTEDILKKNGFKEFGTIWDFPDNPLFGVEIATSGRKGAYPTYDECVYFTCAYVHELQRALRCCGLNDIADNIQL